MFKKIWFRIKESFNTAGATAIVVVVIILVVWGAVTILPKAISGIYSALTASLSSTFIPSKEITISSDKKNIESGDTVNISIDGESETDMLYTLYYPCSNNVSLLLNGTSGIVVNCGEDFYLLNKNGSFSLTINSNNARYVSIPLTIKSQNDKGELQNIGSITIGVTNQNFGQSTNTIPEPVATTTITTPSPVSIPVYIAPVYYGNSDLSVNITSVDTSNLYDASVQDQVLVKFEIKNIGTNQTGQWRFGATLPSSNMGDFTSDLQRNLNPGDKIQYTLGFGNVDTTNSSVIKITVDPVNAITESDELNNSASYTLTYNNNYNYQTNTNPGNSNYYYSNNNGNYPNLSGSCYGNSSSAPYGNTINWTANANGGNGNYTYLWKSSDGLYGYSQSINQTYSSAGLKYATVVITSGGQTINVACTANTYGTGTYYNAQSDLSVNLVSVGTINNYGQFVQTGQILKGGTAAAKILVINNGNAESGPWSLVASFGPSYPTNSFQITNQASIAPGDRREVMVTFLNVQQIGDNTFSILVDPNNQLSDSNKNNNSLSALLRVY